MHQRGSSSRTTNVVLVLVAAVACGIAATSALLAQPRVRTIRASANQPIVDRLLPDDEIVQVERDVDTVDIQPEPTVQWIIDYAVETAEVIAIVEVEDVAGILVDDGKWIHTKMTGVPREVLKASPRRPLKSVWFQGIDRSSIPYYDGGHARRRPPA